MISIRFDPELKRAYREYCELMCMPPLAEDVTRWIDDFHQAAAEDHQDAVEAYWAEQRRYFRDGV